MKIYAIRDRLINYYMQPFAAPGDKEVMSAVATTINNGANSDIAQAPHHFEIWQLGEVHEDGHIEPSQILVCDCASLIRTGLRKSPGAQPGGSETDGHARPPEEAPSGPGSVSNAARRPLQDNPAERPYQG